MYTYDELKELLEKNYHKYNKLSFIDEDPIQIPHKFEKKEDIEIAAFLTSTIAWGRRDLIIRSANKMMQLLDNAPYDFVMNATKNDLEACKFFVHRTFNGDDFVFFLKSLRNIYTNYSGLENVFVEAYKKNKSVWEAIAHFREIFFEIDYPLHTQKHIANVQKKSAAKRINMFLMWLVRRDTVGVHFGLWKNISMSDLFLPLDVHTANMSRALGLLKRKQNDKKAVEEVTANLRLFDSRDPVKYDFAIFGLDLHLKS
jgi:uncharacterized protein (TIGR02757 family)